MIRYLTGKKSIVWFVVLSLFTRRIMKLEPAPPCNWCGGEVVLLHVTFGGSYCTRCGRDGKTALLYSPNNPPPISLLKKIKGFLLGVRPHS